MLLLLLSSERENRLTCSGFFSGFCVGGLGTC